MSHEIDRILAAVAQSIWLIDEAKAEEIVNLLAVKVATGQGQAWAGEDHTPVYAADSISGNRGAIHVLKLEGTIMPRSGMMSRMSGGASLEEFGRAFDRAASDTTAEAIVLDIDSPGGVVDLVAETATKVYKARRSGRPIIAVANTLAASAAYWIASASDEIVVTPSGRVGSIGVYGMHDDISKALEMRGIQRTLVRSGPRKAEGAVGPLDAAALAHRQASTDAMYAMFTNAVAKYRAVPVSRVRADPETDEAHFGGGRAYDAKTSVRLGLADRVATFDETIARLVRGKRVQNAQMARARLALH